MNFTSFRHCHIENSELFVIDVAKWYIRDIDAREAQSIYDECQEEAKPVLRSADGQVREIRDNLAIFATTVMSDDPDWNDINIKPNKRV